jgi:hypothetical protein
LARRGLPAKQPTPWAQPEFREESGASRLETSFGGRRTAGESPSFLFISIV